nr:MAG TPA: hypothetical protein [Caudoviricetes sp.]
MCKIPIEKAFWIWYHIITERNKKHFWRLIL